jgi:hypothetical protein
MRMIRAVQGRVTNDTAVRSVSLEDLRSIFHVPKPRPARRRRAFFVPLAPKRAEVMLEGVPQRIWSDGGIC